MSKVTYADLKDEIHDYDTDEGIKEEISYLDRLELEKVSPEDIYNLIQKGMSFKEVYNYTKGYSI